MLIDAAETWELVAQLQSVDRAWKKFNPDIEHCPKTLGDAKLRSSINKMTVHAVARWLESIYTVTNIDRQIVRQKKRTGNKYEVFVLQMVFEHLRGGKLNEIQTKLKNSDNHEIYMWLTGNQPFFDNIAYSQTNELDDILLSN